ncbi:MFS transporter [Tepidanaerobacter syntrophicus]|nr:MFS transporter [Tepidanaerobacter syntrophicus]GLI49964.1 MFS transporter [Tepidanaerobacter syntrophicus]
MMNRENKSKWSILIAVMLGSIMAPIDGSIMNIAMPTLTKVFNAPLEIVSWVSMAYLLVVSSTLLMFGRLGDIKGYRPIYQTGLLIFTVSSALCGLSHSISALIAGRVFQAIGGGMLLSMAPAILTAVFPATERGKALGMNAMSVAVGLAIGPSLGGFLVSTLGWEYIFFINVPIGFIALIWAQIVLPKTYDRRDERFDTIGALLAFLFLFSLLLYINRGSQWGWTSAIGIALLALGVLSILAFIIIESRHPEPLLDLSLFKNRLFTAGTISTLLNFSAQYIMTFLTPFYLTQKGLSASTAGAVMTAFPVVMLIVSPISGILSDKIGARGLSTLGAAISALGIFLMSTLTLDSPILHIVIVLAVFGIGNGLFQSPNNSSVMGSVPRDRLGIASSFLATMRNVGMVMGIAVGGAVFSNYNQYFSITKGLPEPDAFMAAIRIAYLAGMALDILCALTSAVRGKPDIKKQED